MGIQVLSWKSDRKLSKELFPPGRTPPNGLRLLVLKREAMLGLFSPFSSSVSCSASVVGASSPSVLLSVVVVVVAGVVDKIFPANLFLPPRTPPGFRRLNSRFDFTRGPLRVTCVTVEFD